MGQSYCLNPERVGEGGGGWAEGGVNVISGILKLEVWKNSQSIQIKKIDCILKTKQADCRCSETKSKCTKCLKKRKEAYLVRQHNMCT